MNRLSSFLLWTAFVLLPGRFLGQTTAANELHGVVVSGQDSAPISRARVILKSVAETTCDEQGRFQFDNAPRGAALKITVLASGFKTWERELPADFHGEVRAELDIEPLQQTVQVESSLEEEIAPAAFSHAIESRPLSELPSNGRNLNRFAMIDPHVRNTQGLGSDGAASARLSINASSFRTTYYLLDGGLNYDFSHGNAPQQKVSVSAVQELKVLTNQYSAEYGRSSSGIIESITKAGGDSLHGEALVEFRPSGIQAAPVASTLRVPNELRQFGGSVGGPLPGGRSNFFANYETVRTARGAFLQGPGHGFYTGHFQDEFGLLRFDHRFGDYHSMYLRLNANHDENDNPNDRVGGFMQPSTAQRARSQGAGVQWRDSLMLGASTVNDLRIGYVNALPSLTSPATAAVSVVRPSYSTEGGSAYSWYRTQSLQFADAISGRKGGHDWKIGADWVRQKVGDFSMTPFGEYRFAPGPPVAGQTPLQYTQTFGTGFVRQGQTLASFFAQDDWKLLPRFTLNLGLRYEYQSLTHDANNVAPRLGLAFDPTGKGDTVVRAAAGVFYDQYYMYITRRFFLQGVNAPTATYTLAPGSAGFPDFPNSLQSPPSGLGADRRDLVLSDRRLLNPYSLQYSLSLQQRIGGWIVNLSGIHSHTLKQMRARDINAPAAFVRTGPGQKRSVAAADATRPFSEIGGAAVRNVTAVENTGSSLYDAFEAGISRRFSKRFLLESRYVYSSAIAYAMFFGEPNTGIPSDWGNSDRQERGPSDFHQRHRWVTSGLFDLPFGATAGLVSTIASGLPVNPLTGVDNNGDTNLVDRPFGLGRNSFRAPANAGFDVSASKRLRLTRGLQMELRAEAFNVFNRSNLVKANATYGDSATSAASFLKPIAGIANSDPARQFQFSLKWVF